MSAIVLVEDTDSKIKNPGARAGVSVIERLWDRPFVTFDVPSILL